MSRIIIKAVKEDKRDNTKYNIDISIHYGVDYAYFRAIFKVLLEEGYNFTVEPTV